MVFSGFDGSAHLAGAQQGGVAVVGLHEDLGDAQALFERPAHTFVGYFVGSPGMNVLPCELYGSTALVAGQTVALSSSGAGPSLFTIASNLEKLEIVALVDEEEATLKRLRRRGNSVALEAANPAYETRIFPPDRVKVQGKLVGLIRRY